MKNHKGFTIVELLVGMTILSIVAVALTGFLVSSSKSYAAANTEIIVQQESQLAMNQISDVVIDTTRSVNYVGYTSDGTPEQVVKDADFTIDVEDKCLILYNGEGTVVVDAGGNPVLDADGNPEIAKDADGKPIITGGNGNKNYQIYWDKSEEKLIFTEIENSETDFSTGEEFVLAEYVKDFSVDLSQVEEKRVVKLTLSYGYNNKVYETSNNITIRNKVLVNSVNLAVNKSIELSIRVKQPVVYLEPGETYQFSTPIIEGRNIIDKSVTWWVSPEAALNDAGDGNDGHTGFKDTDNGIIHISPAEKTNSFEVKVTTNAVDSKGEHAVPATVTVYVKRAKSISMTKTDSDPDNGALEISKGCTFTITADVEGNQLGVTCSNCGDDIKIDKCVVDGYRPKQYAWRVWKYEDDGLPNPNNWDPEQYVHFVSSDEHSATFKVDENTPDDGSIIVTIQATSLLSITGNGSFNRKYDTPVFGAIKLKVVKHKEANISAGGSLHWGSSTDIKWDSLSYFHYYVICARIREYGTEGGDKIMMYLSEGTTTRVTPDMFGVEDVSKPWYLSLQVLNPGKEIPPGVGLSLNVKSDCEAQVTDPTVLDLIDDYLNNCDSTGTYVGTKYLHSDKLEAKINPPEIYYEYDGKKNLGGELKLKPVSAIGGPAWTEFRVDYVKNTRDETLGYWFANNNIKYSMYKEMDDGTLKKIYGYKADGNYYEGESNPYGGFLQLSEIQNASGVKIKLDTNNMGRASEAAGKYRLIPTIIYEQGSWADHVGGVSVYYVNYNPNFKNKQCYEDKRSTVYYELSSGGNMTLIAHDGNNLCKGDTYFKIPSDTSQDGFTKYFNLKDTSLQHAKEKIKIKLYTSGGSKDIEFEDATCEYIASKDLYSIELFYTYHDQTFNRRIKVSAGVFTCASDGEKWIRSKSGTLDGLFESGTTQPRGIGNARIKIPGEGETLFDTYIPVPSDSDFGSSLGLDLDAIKAADGFCDSSQYVITVKYKDGNNNAQDIRFGRIKCRYDKSKKAYILNVTCVRDQNDFDKEGKYTILTLTCQENARTWN